MATTKQNLKVFTDILESGNVLTVTVNTGTAQLQRLLGVDEVERVNITSTSKFGPYPHDMQINISALEGNFNANEEQFTWAQNLSSQTDPATGQTVIVGPNGYPTQSSAPKPSALSLKWIVASVFAPYDGSSFRQIWRSPFSGRCLVMAQYQTNNSTDTTTINFTSFAAGRDINEVDPFDQSGNPSVWQVVTDTVIPVADADAATNGKYGIGTTTPVILDIPVGGYIYVGTRATAGTRVCNGTSAARPIENWQNIISNTLTSMRYRSMYKAGDFVSVNQNGMGVPGNVVGGLNPVIGLIVIPLAKEYLAIDNVGDSTSQTLRGTLASDGSYNPYNYSWVAPMIDARNKAGKIAGWANHAYEGWKAERYLGRYESFLDDNIKNAGNVVILQPFSWNDAFTQATIDSGIAKTLEIADRLLSVGKLVIIRTVGPVNGATQAQDDRRKAANDRVRNLVFDRDRSLLVFDFDAVVSDGASKAQFKDGYTFDGTHQSLAANNAISEALDAFLISNGI